MCVARLLAGMLLIPAFIFAVAVFRPVAAQEIMRFAVIGDFGSGDRNEEDVANLVKSWNPDFILTTGDNNYPDGELATIDRNIGFYYHDFIYPYNGAYGTGAAVNRFFPTMGNHDWDNDVGYPGQPYFEYFTLPGNERYYELVKGPIHFFSIDSDKREPDGITSTSVQGNWLRTRLAASTATWKIVLLHHPPYSSRTSWPKLQWPYQEWGANLVLSGHAHLYERIIRNGLPFITNGLGGDSTGDFSSAFPGSVCRFGSNFGAMLVRVSATSITFQFITRTGVIIDTYTMGPDAVTANPPAGLTAISVSSTQANLSWTDNAINEDGYRIERSTNGGAFVEIGSKIANETTFSATGLSSGSIYSFRVRAINNAGYSAYSNTADIPGGTGSPPASPANLTAAAFSSSQINLSWTDASSNETGFKVERCEGSGCTNFAEFGQTSAGVAAFQDAGRAPLTTYRYRVRAFNGSGNSGYTNTAEATTPSNTTMPEPPTNLSATAVSSTRINLTWTDDSGNEDGFKIEQCAGEGCTNFAQVGQTGANVATFADTGLAAQTVYRYRVRAFLNTFETAYSNTAQATTQSSSSALFSDDYNDGVRDTAKWDLGLLSRSSTLFDPAIQVTEQNGRLTIAPRSGVTGDRYAGYVSAATWNMAGGIATVEVAQKAADKAVTLFSFGNDRNNWFGFRAKGNTLYLERRAAGTTTSMTLDYNAAAHRFWRFRHDAASDTVNFETSPDGTIWTTQRSLPRQFVITAVKFELVAGTGESVAAPGSALFDNFRHECLAGC